jgi:hypothetical protein
LRRAYTGAEYDEEKPHDLSRLESVSGLLLERSNTTAAHLMADAASLTGR